jgi:ABC-type Zn uptake system ZnuABC Zn-binding protein ZnuA/membrane protein YqaA with SNARE-associated domain
MDVFIQFLISYGYWGMLLSAFIAGSILPFSSEAVMWGLLAAGLHPWPLIIYGSIGNVLGGLFNYGIGRMGKLEWIEKYLHVKKKELDRAERFMAGRGAWMGIFAALPVLGDAITIALGLMRANFPISFISMTISKTVRYVILIGAVTGFSFTGYAPGTFSSITGTPASSAASSEKPQITVSIEPLRYFTEQIAGNRYKVTTLVPGNSSPETYEPTAQQMMEVSESKLFIKMGNLGFERTWIKRLQQNAPEIRIVNASQGIATLHADPHTWTSCRNAHVIARNIFQALVRLHAKDSLYYKANLARLDKTISKVDSSIRQHTSGNRSRAFIIYHPALTYFAAEYGLRQFAIEEEGREPSAQQLQTLIQQARRYRIQLLLVQEQFANRNTSIIQQSTGASIRDINPLAYNWPQEMKKIGNLFK